MKRLFGLVCAFFAVGLLACEPQFDQELIYHSGQNVVNNIVYVQDNRPYPPICYAHYVQIIDEVGYAGGSALATVPCENVQQLIINRQ